MRRVARLGCLLKLSIDTAVSLTKALSPTRKRIHCVTVSEWQENPNWATQIDVCRRYKHQNSFMAEKAHLRPARVCVKEAPIWRKTCSHMTRRGSPSTRGLGSWTLKGLGWDLTGAHPPPPKPGYLLCNLILITKFDLFRNWNCYMC